MGDFISREDTIEKMEEVDWYHQNKNGEMVHGANPSEHQAWYKAEDVYKVLEDMPPAQPEIVRCHKCGYWDRDSLRHRHNDFRDWNEAECKILAERDPYDEINRYTEADDYCSNADRRQE